MMAQTSHKLWVWMDVSATCNLSCRDCYTKKAHESVLLSLPRFNDILLQFRRPSIDIQKLHMNWRGEPLTNKHLTEMLRRKSAVLNEVPLEFHTHGLLVTPHLAAEIISAVSDNDRIYVSIDGGWPELHEANRGPGTWIGALRGLRMLLDARDQAGRKGPILAIYEISYERRTRAHPDLVALGRRCDEWTRVSPVDSDGRELAFTTELPPSGPCFWAGHAICVTAKGDVHICLLSFRPDGLLGNLFSEDLNQILQRATEFRTLLKSYGRHSVAHCHNCHKSEGHIDEVERAVE